MTPELEVVIVHHRTPTLLLAALEQLARHAPSLPVTVVDTAFDPSLPRQLEGAHPRLAWRPAANHSYGYAVNVGLKSTSAPLVATMNADVAIGPTTFDDLVAAFADPRVALAGPVARTPLGSVQDLGWPYRWHVARLRWRGRAAHPHLAGMAPWVAVPWLSGCLLVVRRAATGRLGGMDGSLRFYNEDLEWGQRAVGAGLRCAFVHTEVVHVGGAATPPDGRFLIEGLRGGYALTRRRWPPAVRFLHRWGVAAAARVLGYLARDPGRRATWREVERRFVRHDLDASPFGASLAEAAADEPRVSASVSDPAVDRAAR